MLPEVRVAVVQFESRSAVTEVDGRKQNVDRMVEKIKELGESHDLIVFPELATTGYITMKGYDQKFKLGLWKQAEDLEDSQTLRRIAEATAPGPSGRGCTVVVGFPQRAPMKYEMWNAVGLVEDGRLLGVQHKVHIPVEENHYFVPGGEPAVVRSRLGRIGLQVCYDMLFPETTRVQAVKGAEIIVTIAGWADLANLKRMGELFPVARAVENGVHFVFCNATGDWIFREHRLRFYGCCRVVNAVGNVLAESSVDGEDVVSAVLTESDLERGARVFPIFRDRRPSTYGPIGRPYEGVS